MGFYIKKALKVGPFRFNLSKSGIGVSAGIKGLRLGTGPRGNYVHMGRGGLYFRQTLSSPGRTATQRTNFAPSTPTSLRESSGPSSSVGPLENIESASVLEMIDASSRDLLRELNEKRRKLRFLPAAVAGSVMALLAVWLFNSPAWIDSVLIVVLVLACWLVSMKDALRKTTVVLYDLDADVEHRYTKIYESFRQLGSCARTWHIEAKADIRDRKYHAGAGVALKRTAIAVRTGTPPFVETNIAVPLLSLGKQLLAFMPDRLLVFETNAVGAVSYGDLTLEVIESRFVEDETVPHDAAVVATTWRYVNQKGGPDRRFKDNREIPICAYEQIRFSSPTGLNEIVQVSRRGVGDILRSALESIRELGGEHVAPAV